MNPEEPTLSVVTYKDVYASLIQLIIHAETISWTRFYNFLVFNTILIVAWTTIYVKDPPPSLAGIVMVIMCAVGILSGMFWACLGVRGRKFLEEYIRLIKDFEDERAWPSLLNKYKLGTLTDKWGKNFPYGWARSNYLLIGGPLVFTAFYAFLFYVSLYRRVYMDWQAIEAVATASTAVIILVSVFILYGQLKGVRVQLRNSTIGNYWAQWVEMDKWFANNPDLKPYFYSSKDDPNTDKDLSARIDSTAEMLLDGFANLYYQSERIGHDKEWSTFRGFIERMYTSQPCFKSFVDKHTNWYSPEFIDFIRRR